MALSLAEAIDRLYDDFAHHPRPTSIACCPCCFDEKDASELLSYGRLRTTPADALRPYAASVLFTVGGLDDYRHYLPRIMEIACVEGFAFPDFESVVGRLDHAAWTTWPRSERDAVHAFLDAIWEHALFAPDPLLWVDETLCGLGNAVEDLGPYLATWADNLADDRAAQRLLSFLTEDCRVGRDGLLQPTNAYWAKSRRRQVEKWLASPLITEFAGG
ncbi:MAG: hypothetical protein HOV79_11330 [Hamadaea sp.]|nr:hypothetical protein [Hamadaea sp.]